MILVDVVKEVLGLDIGQFKPGYSFLSLDGQQWLTAIVQIYHLNILAGLGYLVIEPDDFLLKRREVLRIQTRKYLTLSHPVSGGDHDFFHFAGPFKGQVRALGKYQPGPYVNHIRRID